MSENYTPGVENDAFLESLFEEHIDRYVLDNGLTVLFKEDRSAELATVQTWVKTGSIHEQALLGAGVSHFVEHMLFKGTEKRSPHELTAEVHQVGGYTNAYTTYDRTVYYIDVPSEAAETAFDVLSDMCFCSKFDDDEINRERDVILREIDMGKDDPDRQLFGRFTQTAFRTHPYRFPVIGHRALYEKVTADELRDYYHSRYAPNNMVLVVVGSLSGKQVREWTDQYFGQEPMRRVAPPYFQSESPQMAARIDRSYGDFNIIRGMLGYKIPGLSHEDSPALDILSTLLGHGHSSVLNQRLREELQLVHQIDTACWNPGESGLFWVSYLCDEGDREEVETEIAKVLDQVIEHGLDEALLKKAMRQAMVSEVNVRKTMSGQASRMAVAEVVVGDLQYPRVYFQRLQSVTAEDLKGVARRYFQPSALTSVSLEPEPTSSAPAVQTRQSESLEFEEVSFKSGAKLLLQPAANFPKIHMRTAFLGGPLYEAPTQRGATGLLATLLTRDTEQRSAREVAETIEGLGGSFSEFAGNNTFGLGLEVLSADFPVAVDIWKQALTAARFDPEIFELEREGQLASLLEGEDEIVDYGKRRLRQRFFGEHPYAIDFLGREADLKGLSIPDIEKHSKQLIAGKNTVVSVTGVFERNAILDTLGPVLEGLSNANFSKKDEAFQGPVQPGAYHEELDREQSVVFQAYPDVGVTGEGYQISEILDEIFSGMASQLFLKVREEKGLAYYVGSSRMIGVSSGMFYFYGGTHPSQTDAVLAEIDAEIERVKAGKVTAEELRSCQTRLKVQKRMSMQTPGARAMNAALNSLYSLNVNAWKTYDAEVDAIKLADLQAFARKYFVKEKEVRLVVGPAAS